MPKKERGECYSCGYQTMLNVIADGIPAHVGKLCDICYCSHAGNAYFYPGHYPDRNAMRMIAYCTNLILKEIKRAKR